MRRLVLLALLALGVAGCASATIVVPVSVKAPPQTARPHWKEPYPAVAPALVFGVTRFAITREGWEADISVENRSSVGWKVGDMKAGEPAFGVLLFPDDDLGALERRSRGGDLPAIRAATSYNPALPLVLGPDKTWKGTIAAPGALAGGLWIRLSFGPFISVGKPPEGAAALVVWFTDHALRLEQVAAEPA